MFKDLTGLKFGKLTVLNRDEVNPKSAIRTYWICQCDCGSASKSIAAQSLLRNSSPTISCGCMRNAEGKNQGNGKVDMIGKRFGRLLVLNESEKRSGKRKKLMYDCLCDCGNTYTALGEGLRKGTIQSCGCYYKETRGIASKNYNSYDLESYSHGVGYCENGTHFFFDKEDYFKIKEHCWWYDGRYVIAHSLQDDKFTTAIIRMHRVVMDIKDREDINVDHLNHVRYDCRKTNLRKATDEENARNKPQFYCTLENPVGVHKINDSRYDIYILKQIRGSHDNLEDAIKHRQELEVELYGDFRFNPEQQKIIETDLESEIDSLLLCSNQ